MPDHTIAHFSIGDYVVFSAMLGISLAIGVFFSKRGNETSNDFLLGGRGMSVFPVSMSLTASSISAISLLGSAGEIYSNGLAQSLSTVGSIAGLLAASYLFIPVFYELKMTTINEYITLRFKSEGLRILVLILGLFKSMTYTGICLYAPTVALSSVTPLDSDSYVIILGIICTIYSTIGGIKAVVWTDVFQTAVMFGGVIAIIIITTIDVGGIADVFRIASEGGRTDILNFDLHPHVRHSIINVILMGFTFKIAIFGTSQIYLQRICSVGSLREAKLVAFATSIGQIAIFCLVYYSGLCAYATYAGCDPISLGAITRKDEIMPYLVMDKINYFFLPGIFVSTVFSGALSSLSSLINALAAILWIDVLKKIPLFKNSSERTATFMNKVLSALVGGCMIGVGFMAKNLGGLIQAALTVGGISAGPILGVFICGTCCPWVDYLAAGLGLILSWVIMVWIGLGGFMYKEKVKYLPMSTEKCFEFNKTMEYFENITSLENFISNETDIFTNITSTENVSDSNEFPLLNLYKVSYAWYPLMGFILCMIFSLIIGLITGGMDPNEVPLEALAVPLRKIYSKRRIPKIVFDEIRYSKVSKNGEFSSRIETFDPHNCCGK